VDDSYMGVTLKRMMLRAASRVAQRLKARLAEGELEVRVEDNHRTPVTLSLLD
ncbi:hypothetical protein HKT47_28175, partial [Pseudomonas aeruginosa]|uniref:hypothetical protein n=1 Tax=Pseudomonas aeruginosa TaxID=287 RepID=UPI001889E434